MSVCQNDFLDFAKSLSPDSEINRRNIISRSYYSAYHLCLEKYKPANTNDGGVHKQLISQLKISPDKHDRAAGYILDQLKNLRVVSDYHLNSDVSKSDSDTALLQSEKLKQYLDNIK